MMKVEFNTYAYECEYGKRPSGRGSWFFSFEGRYTFDYCGLYSEAKKACRDYVKKVAPKDYVGTVTVKVEL